MSKRDTQLFCIAVLLGTILGSVNVDVFSASSPTTLTIDLQNDDLIAVFRKIAEVSGLNLIVSPEVHGTISAHLVEVPWEQALAMIVKMHRLAQQRYGNIIIITPLRDVEQRRQQARQRRRLDSAGEIPVTRVVAVNYADADVLKTHLDNLLGHCASIGVDARTNSLILTGTPSCLQMHYVPQR